VKRNLTPICTRVRWMIRKDMPRVLDIEFATFDFPWCKPDFIRCLRQQNCIGIVCEHDGLVVGYMIYELHRKKIRVLNFAVAPGCRRQGVGRAMVAKLKSKLSEQRRFRICLAVRERNLDAQLFFRSQGFQAVTVIHRFYEVEEDYRNEDAILFQFRHRPEDKS